MYFVQAATVSNECVEVSYIIKRPGNVVNSHTDFLYTQSKGWTYLKFSDDGILYSDFLNTLVEKNVDVYRKMCRIEIDTMINKKHRNLTKINLKIMNAICILDPTFKPPIINVDCGWQRQFLNDICNLTSFHVIATCRNHKRMQRFFNVLRALST